MRVSPELAPEVIQPSPSDPRKWDSCGGETTNPVHGALRYLFRIAGPTGFGSGSTADEVAAQWDGRGKVAVITGASSGLGEESARVLASRGCEVVLACRNQHRAQAAAQRILQQHPSARLVLMQLDTSSLASVKQFADAYRKLNKPLHILMLNAGVVALPAFGTSPDGHELQWATNHLGHFHLARLLQDTMLATAHRDKVQGRVVLVSSAAHRLFRYPGGTRIGSINSPKGYHPWRAYGQSKLANILTSRQMSERLQGWPVAVAACHPGVVNTQWTSNQGLPAWLVPGLAALASPFLKGVQRGAATQVFLATAPAGCVVSGEYYQDCNPGASSPEAHSRALASSLWDVSERMVAGETEL